MKKLILLAVMFMALIVPNCVKAFDMPFDLNGYYISANASCNFLTNHKKHHSKVTFDPGYLLAPAVGYRFCNGIRVEGEFAYRHNANKKIKAYGVRLHVGGHIETFAGLANMYYDFPTCWMLKPYVGAGIGYGYSKLKLSTETLSGRFSVKGHRSGFAWQLIAGAAFPICDNVDLAVEYRFFRNEAIRDASNNDIGASLRYYF